MKKIIAGVLATSFFVMCGVAAAADGGAIYSSKCLPCHGKDGLGTAMAPALAGSEFMKSSADGQVAEVILKGRQGADKLYKNFAIGMPPQKLSPDEARDVIAYLRSLAGK